MNLHNNEQFEITGVNEDTTECICHGNFVDEEVNSNEPSELSTCDTIADVHVASELPDKHCDDVKDSKLQDENASEFKDACNMTHIDGDLSVRFFKVHAGC